MDLSQTQAVEAINCHLKKNNNGFSLDSREVHLWCLCVSAAQEQVQQLQRYLSEDELAQAGRFHFENDRRRFILARGMLRTILSFYRPRPPKAHAFSCDRYGKPHLLDSQGLCFNLSHSGTQIVYGLAHARRIGVDIERVRPLDNCLEIVETHFSEDEKRIFQLVPEHQKSEAFFNCWTRKEAYVKARGQGLQIPLDRFTVSFLPGEPAKMVKTDPDSPGKRPWTLWAMEVAPGYAAAVAVEGEKLVIKRRRWSGCLDDSEHPKDLHQGLVP